MALRQVDCLARPAKFAVKGMELYVQDVMSPAQPKCIFKYRGNAFPNSDITISRDGTRILVADSQEIWSVSPDGEERSLGQPLALPNAPKDAEINWELRMSDADGYLYFVALLDYKKALAEKTSRSWVNRWHLDSGELQSIEYQFPIGLDFNFETGAVYGVIHTPKRGHFVGAWRFDGTKEGAEIEGHFAWVALSPSKSRLLVSGSELSAEPCIGIVNLEDWKLTIIEDRGSDAAWASESEILFLRGENTLWRKDLKSGASECLIAKPGVTPRAAGSSGSNARPPVFSKDRGFAAWKWTTSDDGKRSSGAALIDLNRGEYREIENLGHHMAWL